MTERLTIPAGDMRVGDRFLVMRGGEYDNPDGSRFRVVDTFLTVLEVKRRGGWVYLDLGDRDGVSIDAAYLATSHVTVERETSGSLA